MPESRAVGVPRSRTAGEDRQLLQLNHCYGVLDAVTAEAVEKSEYLRTFAGCHPRTTTDDSRTWTGWYLMGRTTYLELFKVGDVPGPEAELGSAGVGLSVERAGELAAVVGRLPMLGVPTPVERRQTRDFGDGVVVPWFRAVYPGQTYDACRIWGMEYEQSYFADPRSKSGPAAHPGDVSRERYLDDYYRPRQLRDLTAVRVAVTADDLAGSVPLLRAGGYTVREEPGGVVAVGGGTVLRFDAVPRAAAGLRQVAMALLTPVPRAHSEKIGNSTLTVGPGSRAVWTFASNA
ncbi:DUF5829 family protein [Amycolatopsis plumensis]|uniref:DUF5829 family protein n=1 Tax=Amycolatopsis plumensis TaxID=236508 RepID=A0ABV5UF60_9PSEU